MENSKIGRFEDELTEAEKEAFVKPALTATSLGSRVAHALVDCEIHSTSSVKPSDIVVGFIDFVDLEGDVNDARS